MKPRLTLLGAKPTLMYGYNPAPIGFTVMCAYYFDVMMTLFEWYRSQFLSKPCLDFYDEIVSYIPTIAENQQYDLYEHCIVANRFNFPGYVDFNDAAFIYFSEDEVDHVHFIEEVYRSCHATWFHPIIETLRAHAKQRLHLTLMEVQANPTHTALIFRVTPYETCTPTHDCHLPANRRRASYSLPF